ncbi:MAG: GIY-YIG nuclease family protein [Acidimicrobiales bacterium]|nr:GIY-YIG nuclease family protein [Hyphomonadaceae bacterium]RZV43868.1 MAG: GIY-YIG nuclease family protein [Acidimicrobiales bacterium]
MKKGYVYLLASRKYGTLYVGVTSDLQRRLHEHENGLTPGFSSRHKVSILVWYEEYDLITDAIAREKQIKKYKRQWKINLIEAGNPDWKPLLPY